MDVLHSFQALGLGGSMSISIALVRGIDVRLRRSIWHQDTVRLIMLVCKEFDRQSVIRRLFGTPVMARVAALATETPHLNRNRLMRMRRWEPSGCPASGDISDHHLGIGTRWR